ncbi:MAG: glycosyltransferase family 4 protein [Hydrogenophilaceae bacterium]|jgi:glycosyltransferase involved in cell wall biosynthesis|nr:glycosyltransferase family 4 protein [Hydrogenophilaceae bacterium]
MAVILQVAPALDAGGVERTTIEVAEALVRAGHTALVASKGGRLEAELAAVGGELVRMDLTTKNPWRIWKNAAAIADLARARNVALIHARSRAPAWSAYWAARRIGLPFVTTYHGIYKADWPGKRLYNSVMAKGDIVIANSSYTRAHVIVEHRVEPERVIAIPRGVDLAIFDPAAVTPERVAALRQAWAIDAQSGLVFLLPARLTRWKGQRIAIEATARALRRAPRAMTLVIAGDPQGRDAYVEELKARAVELGVADRVRIVGHVADMPAALRAADVVVTPSLEPEAFGRSAAEAQAMGVPVIASEEGGFAETVAAGESGMLAPPGDVEALAAAMTEMIEMSETMRRTMGEKAASRARALYAKEALQTATLRIYERLIGRPA